jgi:hypothetical protein
VATGTVEIDFGAAPTDAATVLVSGLSGLTAGSFIEAFIMREPSSENDAAAHEVAAFFLRLVCEFVSASSFNIIAQSLVALAAGKFTARWVTV